MTEIEYLEHNNIYQHSTGQRTYENTIDLILNWF